MASLTQVVTQYLDAAEGSPIPDAVLQTGVDALPAIAELAKTDMPIDRVEKLESVVKAILKSTLTAGTTGPTARTIAEFQKEIGFFLKYKSYAIKAANPLGYSVFLQNPSEGFSYQRHITHKTEVFHILDVLPGGFVFLCDYRDWDQHYERATFERWLAGEPHPFFDRCRFTPQPGDVFVISELGVVHTVVGCILEEFATVSTDMVDRLHDQNAGKPVPEKFTRSFAESQLAQIKAPPSNRRVDIMSQPHRFEVLPAEPMPGGFRVVLEDSFVRAVRCGVEPGSETALESDPSRATVLRVFSGEGSVRLVDDAEIGQNGDDAIPIAASDLIMVPPGISFSFQNESSGLLEYSEHRIAPAVAFI